jgi:hypothetical protein
VARARGSVRTRDHVLLSYSGGVLRVRSTTRVPDPTSGPHALGRGVTFSQLDVQKAHEQDEADGIGNGYYDIGLKEIRTRPTEPPLEPGKRRRSSSSSGGNKVIAELAPQLTRHDHGTKAIRATPGVESLIIRNPWECNERRGERCPSSMIGLRRSQSPFRESRSLGYESKARSYGDAGASSGSRRGKENKDRFAACAV